MLVKHFVTWGMAALLLTLPACGDDPEPAPTGDLQVTYRVGSGSSTCQDAGIAFVRVHVDRASAPDVRDELFPCDQNNQTVTFTDLAAGNYTIRVEGVDTAGNITYQSASSSVITVVANQTNGPVSMVLDQLRPSMQVFFGFSSVGGCDRFGVIDLVVVVYQDGSAVIYDQTVDCATQITGSVVIDGLTESSTYDLRVRGTNDNGEYTYQYNEDGIVVTPGGSTQVSAELQPCSGLCSAP